MKLKQFLSRIIHKKNLVFWIIGALAIVWLMIRSGRNPKRMAYPCQQAAFPLAFSWLAAVAGIFGGVLLWKKVFKFSIISLIIVLAGVMSVSALKNVNRYKSSGSLPEWEVSSPTSEIFILDTIYPTSGSLAAADATVPDSCLSDPSIDSLFKEMTEHGLFLCNSTAHPTGVIESDDIVVIKGNFQWTARLGTSTDRIKGLIWQILNHPDGYTGEILVCDNTQQYSVITHNNNNSDDTEQSIIDVVNCFSAKGYPVYLMNWEDYRETTVDEYDVGDLASGYIFDTATLISYPKFQTPSGNHYLSLRYGVWDNSGMSYDRSKLCIINFPVLKAHGMAGATIALKNWIGMLTTGHFDARYGSWDAMHYTYFWGDYCLVPRVMAVTFPDLTLVDATYTATVNNYQQPPGNTVIKTDKLLASTDPTAVSWYAAKYILTPIANSPNRTDPDNIGGDYSNIIRKWNDFLVDSAGFDCTLDSANISVYKFKAGSVFTDVTAPTAPQNIESVSASVSEISLAWDAADDNVGVTGYYIYQDGTKVDSVNALSYSATGLSSSTQYSFYIVAYDAQGNISQPSATINASTRANNTGVRELKQNVQIFPNPVEGNVVKVFNGHNANTFSIVNLSGKVMTSGKLETGNNEIEIKNYEKGIYIFLLHCTHGEMLKTQFVVQ